VEVGDEIRPTGRWDLCAPKRFLSTSDENSQEVVKSSGLMEMSMKQGFVPIKLEEYVKLYLKNNRGESAGEVTANLLDALRAHKSGTRCECGNPIWVVGSAVAGYACFTCITGEAYPDEDYEIDEAL
jgi:hypothetical protein